MWAGAFLRTPAGADIGALSGLRPRYGSRAMDVAGIRQHTIGDLPRRTAARYPSKLAVSFGETRWTYRELDEICSRLANGLIEQGIASGDRVAILSRNSHAFVALRFALARLGGVLVPINFMLNAQEIAFILRSSGARALAVSDEFLETGSRASALDTAVTQTLRLSQLADLLSADGRTPAVAVASDGLAQIVYTSGTEALPKGAMLTHDAVLWQYVSCIVDAEIDASDVILHALPMYHCAQLDVFLGPAVYQGATSVVASVSAPEVVLPLIAEHRITSFFAPPTVWIGLLRSPLFDELDHSSLRKGYYGASIMPVEVLREIKRRVPELRLWNLYGQTEIAPLATVLGPDEQLARPGSCGRPVLNVETRVVDDGMNDVKPGEVGEIVHRSPQLLAGYYDAPDKTAAAFEGGWFRSGDLATVDDDGYITVVDRKKDMIKTGGENVASREVEEAIYRLPQVSEVAVIGLPDPKWIEAVSAVVVVKPGQSLQAQTLITHCQQHLAAFKVPKRVFFSEALPKNPSGKILKRQLRQEYQASASAAAEAGR
jgi:fatty-acyl-CoA synthase